MWADAPGGWVQEWCKLASRYVGSGQHFLASLAYGCAKFPCLADAAKTEAQKNQVTEYVAAAPTFPHRFERRILSVPHDGDFVDVPVHLLTAAEGYSTVPVLIASGGVDTWKMDIHSMWVSMAQSAGVTVLVFDQPGTGEMPVQLGLTADEVVVALANQARSIGDGQVAHFGLSFGANLAAMTGLTRAVDCRHRARSASRRRILKGECAEAPPYGMRDIVGNALGFDSQPSLDEYVTASSQLSRSALLDSTTNAPRLVINGADDYFVPQSDTLRFQGRQDAQVQVVPDTGHCAISKTSHVMPSMIGWLRAQLGCCDQPRWPRNPRSRWPGAQNAGMRTLVQRDRVGDMAALASECRVADFCRPRLPLTAPSMTSSCTPIAARCGCYGSRL